MAGDRATQRKRARAAESYDEIADWIDSGRLTIVGADPQAVAARLRDKAARSRNDE